MTWTVWYEAMNSARATVAAIAVGVSVWRVEDITEALWSSKVSSSTISELNKKRILTLTINGIVLSKAGCIRMLMWMRSTCATTGGGEFENVAILVSIVVKVRTTNGQICTMLCQNRRRRFPGTGCKIPFGCCY